MDKEKKEVTELKTAMTSRYGKTIYKVIFRFAEKAVRGQADYMMVSTATRNWRAILHFYLEELDMDFWSARLFKKLEGGT